MNEVLLPVHKFGGVRRRRRSGRLVLEARGAVESASEKGIFAGAAARDDKVAPIPIATPDNTSVAFRMKRR